MYGRNPHITTTGWTLLLDALHHAAAHDDAGWTFLTTVKDVALGNTDGFPAYELPQPCPACGWHYSTNLLRLHRVGIVRLDPNPTHLCRPAISGFCHAGEHDKCVREGQGLVYAGHGRRPCRCTTCHHGLEARVNALFSA